MTLGNIQKTFKNRNVLTISLTNSLLSFFNNIYNPYWSKYLKDDIGFTLPQIGLLRAIQRGEELLFNFPGGILADRIGRKNVTVIGAAVRTITPLIYLIAGSWEMLLFGAIINSMHSIAHSAQTAMIAESLPREQRGTGYGIYEMVRRVPMLFTGIIGGILMDMLGIGGGTRVCFIGGFFLGIIITLTRLFLLTETLSKEPTKNQSFKEDLTEVLPLFKGSLGAMQITSAIYQFAAGLTSEFIIIYVTEVIGLSFTQWGLITSIMSIVSLLTSLPGGITADRFNRVKLIALSRAIHPLTTIGYIYLRDFYLILTTRMVAGVGMGLSGAAEMATIGGASWNSLVADMVPQAKRGRFSGLVSTFNGIVGLPSPYVGAYLWQQPAVGPENTMWVTIILGLFSLVIFSKFVKDPRYQSKEIAKIN